MGNRNVTGNRNIMGNKNAMGNINVMGNIMGNIMGNCIGNRNVCGKYRFVNLIFHFSLRLIHVRPIRDGAR